MTNDEVYQAALGMSAEERAAFKAFLRTLLDSGDTAEPPASDEQESD